MADTETTVTSSGEGTFPATAAPATTTASAEGASSSASASPAGDASGWNGELDHLGKQEWFTKLDEGTRKAVTDGVRSKYTNLETGYNRKFQETATARKEWEAKERKLTARIQEVERESLLYKDIFGQGSPQAEDVESRLNALREEYKAKYDPLEKELSDLRTYKTAAEQKAQAAYQQQVQVEATRMQEAYADILESDPAADYFEKLLRAEFEEAEAAELTRTKFRIEVPRLPGAAAHASRGDSPPVRETLPFRRISSRDLIEKAVEAAARQRGMQ